VRDPGDTRPTDGVAGQRVDRTGTTLLVNVVLFQVGWFACVVGASRGLPWLGVGVVGAIVAWHASRALRPRTEIKLVLVAVLVGTLFETALSSSGLLQYHGGVLFPGTAPVWMVALWGVFATTLNVSLRWLHGRPLLAALLGAAGGPIAYVSGARLGALHLEPGLPTIIAIGIGWAMLTPLLVSLARRLEGNSAS
jgi:hypothetical protein